MYDNSKKFTKEELKKKQETLDKRKLPIVFSNESTPVELAQVLFRLYQRRYPTFYGDVETKAPKKMQCRPSALRSVEDAYNVAKTYIPGITYEQVYNAVTKLYGRILSPSYCYTVRKRVHAPANITSTLADYRRGLGVLNIKNEKAIKSIARSSSVSGTKVND